MGKNTIVSEVEVDRQQWKAVGASVGSNAEPVSVLEVAECKNVAGDSIQKKLSKKLQQKPFSKMEEEEATVSKMELELGSKGCERGQKCRTSSQFEGGRVEGRSW